MNFFIELIRFVYPLTIPTISSIIMDPIFIRIRHIDSAFVRICIRE